MEKSKELSIIITCWDNWRYTANCIAHIFKSNYPKEKYQIILIDNNSTDKTETLISYLVECGEPILYLKQKENMGFVKGNNIGWKIAQTPYILLLNNDAYINENCISELMEVMQKNIKTGAVGAIEFAENGFPTKGNKPFIFFKPKYLLDPICKSLQELNLPETTEFVDVDIAGSACLLLRKDSVPDGYLFDERFHPAHLDQEDLEMRIKLNGYRIIMSTKAYFVHKIAGTTARTQESLEYYMKVLQINRQKFLDKWLKYWETKEVKQ